MVARWCIRSGRKIMKDIKKLRRLLAPTFTEWKTKHPCKKVHGDRKKAMTLNFLRLYHPNLVT